MLKIFKVVILSLLICLLVRKVGLIRIEDFWMPGKPETPFGTPLSVPYRYTTSGLSYRMRDEHQLGLPTRQDFIRSSYWNNYNNTSVSIFDQHKVTKSGIGVDITNKMSGLYINPGILGPEKWSFYKLD